MMMLCFLQADLQAGFPESTRTETGPLATTARQGRNWSESSGFRVAWRQPTVTRSCGDRGRPPVCRRGGRPPDGRRIEAAGLPGPSAGLPPPAHRGSNPAGAEAGWQSLSWICEM